MKRIESVSLIGLGAIGAAYGSKLHELLKDSFRVVANEERVNRYQSHGVKVNGKVYHFNCVPADAKVEPADLVIFSVKNADLSQAMKDIQHHIGSDTIILSLLNGISSEEEIYSVFKSEHILHSMSVEIDAVRKGDDTRFSTLGRVEFGDQHNVRSEDVLAVRDLFERAGIDYVISDNILHTMWWKFMINVSINQTSAVLNAPYGVFQTLPSAYDWAKSVMREVVALSQKTGANLTEADIDRFWPVLNHLSPEGKTSMLQDIEAGRKTEVDYFGGTVCKLGEKYDVPTPINEQLTKIIHIIEEKAACTNKGVPAQSV
ncbi:ketopantoate reductase family protein [Siminovitchia sediminis]|uniref:2-dehydropantoate 2-reductase n=1 Tax=Siminovitchia sediminis TaxID=1274353 RepID=A0ABW4KHA1_9BACI